MRAHPLLMSLLLAVCLGGAVGGLTLLRTTPALAAPLPSDDAPSPPDSDAPVLTLLGDDTTLLGLSTSFTATLHTAGLESLPLLAPSAPADAPPPAPYMVMWDYGDGSPPVASSSLAASHAYTRTGSYTATATLYMQGQQTEPVAPIAAQVRVRVVPALFEPAPTPALLDDPTRFGVRLSERYTVTLPLSATDALRWAWDFGDGTPLTTTTTPQASHVYTRTGSYTVTAILRAPDSTALVSTTQAVQVRALYLIGNQINEQGSLTRVGAVLSARYAAAYDTRLHWAFGDGNELRTTIRRVSHVYAEPGAYEIRATLLDATDAPIDTATLLVQVVPTVAPLPAP